MAVFHLLVSDQTTCGIVHPLSVLSCGSAVLMLSPGGNHCARRIELGGGLWQFPVPMSM